jgi:peptide/nickel transport system substrate-binding protein
MKKFLVFYGLIAVLLIAGLLSACAKSTTTTTTTAAATTTTTKPATTAPSTTTTATTETPQYGGTLKIIARGTVQNMGWPQAAFGPDDGTFQSPAVEKIISVDPQGNVIPNIATSWQVSPDYKYMTMTIRKGVKFHDGTICDAKAVAWNLDQFRTGPRPDLKTLSSIDVVDDYTIRLNYATYDPALLANLWAAVGWIVSPTAAQAMGQDKAKVTPIGTGPYKFVSYTPDVSIKFTRFDDYWGGKPYLDNLEFDLIADPVTALATLKSGQAQASIIVGTKDAADMLASGGQYKVNKIPAQVMCLQPDSINATSPFYDVRVRQAVAYSLDINAIAKTVGFGIYDTTNQLAVPGGYIYDPTIAGYPYNVDKAKQLLKDAGITTPLNTTVTFSSTSPEYQDTVTAVQGYLSAVGINAKLDAADNSRFISTYTNGWTNGILFPSGYANSRGSDPARGLQTSLSSKRTRYVSTIIPSDYNNLLLAASTEPDAAKRKAEFQQVNKMAIDQYCLVIPVYEQYFIGVYDSKTLHDFTMNGVAPGVWYPQKAWLSK